MTPVNALTMNHISKGNNHPNDSKQRQITNKRKMAKVNLFIVMDCLKEQSLNRGLTIVVS